MSDPGDPGSGQNDLRRLGQALGLLRLMAGGLFGLLALAHLAGAGGPIGHVFPGGGGAQATLADIVERGRFGVGAGVEGAGVVEIGLYGHLDPFGAP